MVGARPAWGRRGYKSIFIPARELRRDINHFIFLSGIASAVQKYKINHLDRRLASDLAIFMVLWETNVYGTKVIISCLFASNMAACASDWLNGNPFDSDYTNHQFIKNTYVYDIHYINNRRSMGPR